jgi:hypothetical protein
MSNPHDIFTALSILGLGIIVGLWIANVVSAICDGKDKEDAGVEESREIDIDGNKS